MDATRQNDLRRPVRLPLLSNRLILRKFATTDLVTFLAYRNDAAVAQYQSWESFSTTEARNFIELMQHLTPGLPGEWFQIAIALQGSDMLIGDCGLCISAADSQQATIGITLAGNQQGQGFALEALTCLLDYLFSEFQLHRVTADTDPRNARAVALLEQLGMRREAHLHRSLWFKGQWADEYLYAVLQGEWQQRRAGN